MADPTILDAPSPDAEFEAAAAAATENKRRVRVRILAQLYRHGTGQRYKHWNGVSWRLELDPDVATGTAFREALSAFFAALGRVGPQQVTYLLTQAVKDTLPMSAVEEQKVKRLTESRLHGVITWVLWVLGMTTFLVLVLGLQ